MTEKKIVVTGSSGLVGGEVSFYFAGKGWEVHGADNNMRAQFFGPEGNTRWNQHRLERSLPAFTHHELDIRDRGGVLDLIQALRPNAVVHAAAQPSHDLAARIPFEDFEVNAVGTMNLLEAARRFIPESPFIYMSTNKAYGDVPNELPLVELETRWDYARIENREGIDESCRIDQCKHSVMGASKLAADLIVQEYGRYFGMPTCCLRGGCITGPAHSGVELHGFLSYLVKCNVEKREYTVFGYNGKQVRDNIHALDVARFIECFIDNPRIGEVYNLGGGRENSCSVLEAFSLAEAHSGTPMIYRYVAKHRDGDHICYISNLGKAKSHYPRWDVSVGLQEIFRQVHSRWTGAATLPIVRAD